MDAAWQKTPGQLSRKLGQLSPKSGQLSGACADRVVAYLKAQHPSKTAEEIEVATGGRVAAETARKWLSRSSAPSFFACLSLIGAYGPGFLAAVMDEQPDWLSAAARDAALQHLNSEHKRLTEAMARLAEHDTRQR